MRVDGFSLFAEEAEMAFPNRNFQSDRRSICYSAAYTTDRNTILPARELLPPPLTTTIASRGGSRRHRHVPRPSPAGATTSATAASRALLIRRTVDAPARTVHARRRLLLCAATMAGLPPS